MKTKRIILGVALAACLLSVAVASSRQKEQKPPCGEFGTQYEANQCAHKEFVEADAELNKTYNRLVAKLDTDEQRAQLKSAELAWIKYRDANCEFEADFYKGGTMRPMIASFCLARMTNSRAAELKQEMEVFDQ